MVGLRTDIVESDRLHVYDRPVSNLLTPKVFEQGRRDTEHSVSSEHEHISFTDITNVPKNGASICTVDAANSSLFFI